MPIVDSIPELVTHAIEHPKTFSFAITDGQETIIVEAQVYQYLGNDLDSKSRPPMIQFNLTNGSAIRFLSAKTVEQLRGYEAHAVYIAPFASARLTNADHAIINARMRERAPTASTLERRQ
jgi:hypothetical protein